MDIICRLCLETKKQFLNVFSDEAMNEGDVANKIQKYLYVEIKRDDVHKNICLTCLEKLEDFHSFCVQVEVNQFRLICKQEPNCQGKEIGINIIEENAVTNDSNAGELKKLAKYELDKQSEVTCSQSKNPPKELFESSEAPRISPIEDTTSFDKSVDGFDSEENSQVNNEKTINKATSYLKQNNFPEVLIKDSKLVVRGKKLFDLMSKFYKLNCTLCTDGNKKPFTRISQLIIHYTSVHSVKGFVSCCGLTLNNPRLMALHMARHLQPEAFRCPECNKMMTCPKILRRHIQNHLPEESRPLACSQCPRRFSYSSALLAHQVLHLPETERDSHICDECGKTFASTGRLSKHFNVAHNISGSQQFICHECGKQFSCKGNFTYHLTTHEQIHQVQCEICKKWFKNKLCLRKHMPQHSSSRHSCGKCPYTSVNPQSLKNHIKVHHSSDKPFTCDQCGRSFKLKNTLINHMVQHTGIRKYSCEFCKRKFASSGNYYSHRKRMHPTELAQLNQRKDEEQRILRQKLLEKKL